MRTFETDQCIIFMNFTKGSQLGASRKFLCKKSYKFLKTKSSGQVYKQDNDTTNNLNGNKTVT